MKKIAILGSTGSIGTQTLDVVRANGDIEVAWYQRRKKYAEAGRTDQESSHPQLVAVWDENAAQRSGSRRSRIQI